MLKRKLKKRMKKKFTKRLIVEALKLDDSGFIFSENEDEPPSEIVPIEKKRLSKVGESRRSDASELIGSLVEVKNESTNMFTFKNEPGSIKKLKSSPGKNWQEAKLNFPSAG